MKTKHIVIVGGGTAGWLTAINLFKKTFNVKITVVASKEIPIIGVGESTTGMFNSVLSSNSDNLPGIREADFLKETGSTFKFGIMHSCWKDGKDWFASPLGNNFKNFKGYPTSDYDFYRLYHIYLNEKFTNSNLQAQMMINDKIPLFKVDDDFRGYKNLKKLANTVDMRFNHHAYHLDTYKVNEFLRKYLLKARDETKHLVNHVDDIVADIIQDENGFVKSIKTKTGKTIEGDLFIDCTGFKRILMSKLEENNFKSYRKNLLTNRAIAFHIENDENTNINNYTHVIAQKYGWMWDIPLQHRKGCGYVFNDEMITPDEAQKEIEMDLGHKINVQKDIKFEPGRINNAWTKNVLSTGLATGFLEPLEATSIHMTVLQINHFIANYFTNNLSYKNESIINQYNLEIGSIWDDLKDFIRLHYQSKRTDTEFWKKASSSETLSPRLKGLLEIWKTRTPRVADYQITSDKNFYFLGNTLWLQILMGMDLLDRNMVKEELEYFNLVNEAKQDHLIKKHTYDFLETKACPNNFFYKHEAHKLDRYRKIQETEI